MIRQLALPLPPAPDDFAEAILPADSNAAARRWLAADWPGGRLGLWGPEGSGKSHLAWAWTRAAGGTVRDGSRLAATPSHGPTAVDDADLSGERPLLHLINAAAEAGHPLLLVSRDPPARWEVRLPDLASRLRATTAIGIGAAEEPLLDALLARLFVARGLAVAAPVQAWLRARLPREPGVLRSVVARLDRAALAAGGRIGIPLAAATLGDLLDADDPQDAEPETSVARLW